MWTGLLEGTLDVAMGSYTAAQSVLQSNRGVVFAVHSKKVDAIPNVKTLPEQGATSKFFTVSGFTGWALPKATPQPIVDRLAEICVAANSDPKVKEVLIYLRAGTGARLQGNQCAVSARIAGLDRERAGARPGAGLDQVGKRSWPTGHDPSRRCSPPDSTSCRQTCKFIRQGHGRKTRSRSRQPHEADMLAPLATDIVALQLHTFDAAPSQSSRCSIERRAVPGF